MKILEMTHEFFRVPFYVERDGLKTFFLPNCRSTSGYRIGPKGSEEAFAEYWSALEQVASMKSPRFRRPNSKGNFGIVICAPNDFEDVHRDYIEAERLKYGG